MVEAAHELPGALSGGMRKRVAFARATVREPRLLLLDDPTAGLDPINTRQVADSIRSATRGLKASALMVTHDIATAFRVADQVALLDGGKIIEHGAPAQLLGSNDPRLTRFFHAYRDRLRQGDDPNQELR
jgi:phospholipid/cholesterol/gamma-HCH transport system ATP-binding protein